MALPALCGGIRGFLPPAPESEMRETRAQDAVLTDYAHTLIRFKARRLSRKSGFTRSDQDDLEQDLWTVLLSQAESFDPDRASIDTFIDRVVNSAVLMILRNHARLKRAGGLQNTSIDVERTDCENEIETSSTSPSQDDRTRHREHFPIDEITQREDQEAVEHALRQLPAEISEVSRRVMGGSILAASRKLSCSRRQIRNKLAAAGRQLRSAGFDNS